MSLEEFRRQPARRFPDNFKLAHDGTLPQLIIQELFVREIPSVQRLIRWTASSI